jgi:hypothetical protein
MYMTGRMITNQTYSQLNAEAAAASVRFLYDGHLLNSAQIVGSQMHDEIA